MVSKNVSSKLDDLSSMNMGYEPNAMTVDQEVAGKQSG